MIPSALLHTHTSGQESPGLGQRQRQESVCLPQATDEIGSKGALSLPVDTLKWCVLKTCHCAAPNVACDSFGDLSPSDPALRSLPCSSFQCALWPAGSRAPVSDPLFPRASPPCPSPGPSAPTYAKHSAAPEAKMPGGWAFFLWAIEN